LTQAQMEHFFEAHGDEFMEFDRIPRARRLPTGRPDLHAFLLLDKALPGVSAIVAAAEQGEIFLNVELDKLASVATHELLLDLIRCGVRMEAEEERLALFV
jgi:hypothetical protein